MIGLISADHTDTESGQMITRYGAGELYGYDFSALPAEKVRAFSAAHHKDMPCPFKKAQPGRPTPACSKKGGVCSLRQYKRDAEGVVSPVGLPVVTCPQRFLERGFIFEWVGDVLLGNSQPAVISELPFLMGEIQGKDQETDAVGMIDKVLVSAEGQLLKWCALEMQAVYFSGKSMENDFKAMRIRRDRVVRRDIRGVSERTFSNQTGQRPFHDADQRG